MRMKDVYREMLKQGDKYCYLAFDGAKIHIIINYIPNRDKKSSIKSILSNSCAFNWKRCCWDGSLSYNLQNLNFLPIHLRAYSLTVR